MNVPLDKNHGDTEKTVYQNYELSPVDRFKKIVRWVGKKYDKYFVYIPTEVANDSQFPFKHGDELEVRIDLRKRGRLIIEKVS